MLTLNVDGSKERIQVWNSELRHRHIFAPGIRRFGGIHPGTNDGRQWCQDQNAGVGEAQRSMSRTLVFVRAHIAPEDSAIVSD